MGRRALSLTVILVILLFILVGGAAYIGYLLGQKSAPASAGTQEDPLSLKQFKSVNGLAFGRITAIAGRTLTLEGDGEKYQFIISETATVGKFIPFKPGESPSIKQNLKFDDLKTGDWVQVFALIAPDKKIEVSDVTIMPEPPRPPPGLSNSPLPEKSPVFSASPVPKK